MKLHTNIPIQIYSCWGHHWEEFKYSRTNIMTRISNNVLACISVFKLVFILLAAQRHIRLEYRQVTWKGLRKTSIPHHVLCLYNVPLGCYVMFFSFSAGCFKSLQHALLFHLSSFLSLITNELLVCWYPDDVNIFFFINLVFYSHL